jgi:acetyl esterase/lipase
MMHLKRQGLIVIAALMVATLAAHAQSDKPKADADGTIQVPSFALPFSVLASPEAKAAFIARQNAPPPPPPSGTTMADRRKDADTNIILPNLARQKARYAVDVTEQTIGGVFTQVFTPKDGVSAKNKHRLLINLHGGGFIIGARTQSQVESIPLAAVGHIKVISVDYRMAPEAHFPAASEDVAAVYKALLKTYKPADMVIYGCSAGGILTAEAAAWFQKEHLPNPAAIGIFCASTNAFFEGDTAYTAPREGDVLSPPPTGDKDNLLLAYFGHVNHDDPLYRPSASPAVLAKFPPTLLITGSRASEMSGAARSEIELTKAGVDARLYVWDGMEHGFFANPDLPESREAYAIMVKFFDAEMDKAGRRSR